MSANILKRSNSILKRISTIPTNISSEDADPFITVKPKISPSNVEEKSATTVADPDPSSLPTTNTPTQIETTPVEEVEDDDIFSTNPGSTILGAMLLYLCLLYAVYLQFPNLEPHERKLIKVPMNLGDAKTLATILDRYTGAHYWTVLFGFCLAYIFLQTFSVPGSIFLSIMAGFLFPFKTALFLICCCAATGASGCYILSRLFGKKFIRSRFPDEIRQWTEKVNEESDNLLNFMIFLRITPILPNWFINIASPLIGVPLGIFWLGTFIGVAPPSVLAVQGGKTLNVMTSPSDHISWGSIIVMGILALVVLIPVYLRRRSPPNDNEATTTSAT